MHETEDKMKSLVEATEVETTAEKRETSKMISGMKVILEEGLKEQKKEEEGGEAVVEEEAILVGEAEEGEVDSERMTVEMIEVEVAMLVKGDRH